MFMYRKQGCNVHSTFLRRHQQSSAPLIVVDVLHQRGTSRLAGVCWTMAPRNQFARLGVEWVATRRYAKTGRASVEQTAVQHSKPGCR